MATPSGSAVQTFLSKLHASCAQEAVFVSRAALEDAEEMGWGYADIVAQLVCLAADDFEKRVASQRFPWEQIWVFCPSSSGEQLWIRIVERNGFFIISFHPK